VYGAIAGGREVACCLTSSLVRTDTWPIFWGGGVFEGGCAHRTIN